MREINMQRIGKGKLVCCERDAESYVGEVKWRGETQNVA